MYPIDEVRKQFPALKREYNGKQVVYFDGPGGSQAVQSAIDAICAYMTLGGANLHGSFPSSRETEKLILEAREAVATLFNANHNEVAFGANATSLMFQVSRAISKTWNKGDEIILTELDHHSNIDTWRICAEERGVIVKYIPLDINNLTLDLNSLPSLLSDKTKLIAVGAASNCIGTVTDIRIISREAKKYGAIVSVDAVHAAPHFYVDMKEQGIDILFASSYKFFGPHIGMAVIRQGLFENLDVYKIAPSPAYIPDKIETGTQNHEGIPAITAAINFIASFGKGDTLSDRIKSGYDVIEEYESALSNIIREEFKKIDKITLYQAEDNVKKTPTIAFRVWGIAPEDFCRRMCEEHSIFIAEGHFYAMTLAKRLGILENGSFIRAGLAPYNTIDEVNRFIDGVKNILDSL